MDFPIVDEEEDSPCLHGGEGAPVARDLDGIDQSKLRVRGRRTRRRDGLYEQEVFNTDEYRRMMLEDVPEDERRAAVGEDTEDDSESEGEDGDYEEEEEESEEEDDGDASDASDTSDDPPRRSACAASCSTTSAVVRDAPSVHRATRGGPA